MPLMKFWNDSRETILQMGIKQVVANAGDGNILDNSIASEELRSFLSIISTKHLSRYIDTCLETNFDCSGFVLQDIINELGKRLGYQVQHGLYRGKKNAVGFDGVWKISNNRDIVIEAKTTDYYTISLDKIFKYKKRLVLSGDIASDAMVLFVVGRDDSNSLEAQIRGSRYAWDARLISVESLLQLVMIKEKTQDALTLEKIRALIEPIEYTRLDRLVDVVFLSIEDAEKSIEEESHTSTASESVQEGSSSNTIEKHKQVFTDSESLEEKRDVIAEKIGKRQATVFKKQRRAQFESANGAERLCITLSKRYENVGQQKYWYSYHPPMEKYLLESEEGSLVLGMMDREEAYIIPVRDMETIKHALSTTTKDNRHYWHLTLYETDGELYLALPKKNERLSLRTYKID